MKFIKFIYLNVPISKAPVPIRPWKGIYNAQNYGRKCPTVEDLKKLNQSELKNTDVEDCLNMAIYSTNVRINCILNRKTISKPFSIELIFFFIQLNASRPVMVYIHGGRFTTNSADQFPPNYLLEREIVLVVIQFRLSVLGKSSFAKKNIILNQ